MGASTPARRSRRRWARSGRRSSLELSGEELEEIDRYATESSLDIWATSSES